MDGELNPALSAGIGPQTLLSNLPANLQPSSTLFYYNPEEENVLLQQAALAQTGKASFVDGLSTDSQQNLSATQIEKEVLYQNALNYAQANGVQLGTALTQTQVAALDKPMLWYVEQTVPDPSCTATGTATCPTITALMPQVYLPANTSAMSAGGNISGQNVTLNFDQDGNGSILNTGSITAGGTLTVNTNSLTNQANQVDVGQIWSKVEGGYVNMTGTQVQPGGFMSAANMDLNVQTLQQIGGALQQLNADGTLDQAGTQQLLANLQRSLGGNFTQTSVSDNLHQDFVKEESGLPTVAVMVIALALAVVTAGAAAAAIAAAQVAAAEAGMATLIATGSVEAASAAGGIMASSAFAMGGMANLAIAGALGGMAASTVSQIGLTGHLDLGQTLTAGAAGAVTGGVTGYFGASYGIDRLLASTAAGCGTAAMTGGDCRTGAMSGFAAATIAWAGDAMRQNQIESSRQFAGVRDGTNGDPGSPISNASGQSSGINGDGFKLAGTRVSGDDLLKYGTFSQGPDGTWTFYANTIDPSTGTPLTLQDVLNKEGGLTGGFQGLPGTLAGGGYSAGTITDKLLESFAGPHDFLGGLTAYDSLGNLKEGMSSLQRNLFEIQTDLDIPIAAPFAITTFLNQYGLDWSTLRNQINQSKSER